MKDTTYRTKLNKNNRKEDNNNNSEREIMLPKSSSI